MTDLICNAQWRPERMYHRIDRQERAGKTTAFQSSAWIDSKGRGEITVFEKSVESPDVKGQGAYGGSIV